MKTRTTITVLLAAAAFLASGGSAQATTFCVPGFHAGCANENGNVATPSLEGAMSTSSSDGVPDKVVIDGTTVTDPNDFEATGSDPLEVVGSGVGPTRLTSSASVNTFVVNLDTGNTRPITMRDLTVVVPSSIPNGLGAGVYLSGGDELNNVNVESRNPGADGVLAVGGDSAYRGGEIFSAAGGSIDDAVRADTATTGSVLLAGLRVSSPQDAGVANEGAAGTVTVRNSVIADSEGAIVATGGTTNVVNTIIQTRTNRTAVYALANSPKSPVINLEHVTAIGDSGSSVEAQVEPGKSGNSTVNVEDSILRGYSDEVLRQAPIGSPNGNAFVWFDYTDDEFDGSETSSGDGQVTLGPGLVDADPMFRLSSNTDLSLKAGSPAIDAADPADVVGDDYAGSIRPVDGNGDGKAVSDLGAYEYAPPTPPVADTTPPETTITKAPRKVRGKKAEIAFAAEEGSTFACSLDGKSATPCTSPTTLKHLKPGKHRFAVTATDAAGNVDATPATVALKVRRRHGRKS